ncbi:hypothetical protein [Scytonema sp. NUACC26]
MRKNAGLIGANIAINSGANAIVGGGIGAGVGAIRKRMYDNKYGNNK